MGGTKLSLINFEALLFDSAHTTGIVVIQGGKVLFEYGDIQELSYLASCRKSILSMLYGPFIENGTIKLNTNIEQLRLDDIGGLLPIEKKATIKDLLTARSGVYHLQVTKVMLLLWHPKGAASTRAAFGYTTTGTLI
jgi:CubicO group peptidase (beta-lactamase class C family)